MTKVLAPLACLGNVNYFSKLLKADEVVLERRENFVKQTFRNRYEICGANGRLGLTVPVQRNKKDHTPYAEVKISYNHPWQDLHWRSLESAYRSSPYFEYYEDELKPLFLDHQHENLYEYNLLLLKTIVELLELDLKWDFTTEYVKTWEDGPDLRAALDPTPNARMQFQQTYPQVFEPRLSFEHNLSIIDLMCSQGPNSETYLRNLNSSN